MFMVGRERGCNAEALCELARDASVFAGDDISAGEQFEGAQRDVAEVSNRRCHQVEAGGSLGRLHRGAKRGIRAPRVILSCHERNSRNQTTAMSSAAKICPNHSPNFCATKPAIPVTTYGRTVAGERRCRLRCERGAH